jgi:glycosyltransferase involved in cell wall biosynthesis
MACGTPVAATNVSGTPEVVTAPESGMLIENRTPDGIAATIRHLFARLPARAQTRAYAETFSWDAVTEGQLLLFRGIIDHNETAR